MGKRLKIKSTNRTVRCSAAQRVSGMSEQSVRQALRTPTIAGYAAGMKGFKSVACSNLTVSKASKIIKTSTIKKK